MGKYAIYYRENKANYYICSMDIKIHYVYALCSDDMVFKYIGRTTNIAERYYGHITISARRKVRSSSARWFQHSNQRVMRVNSSITLSDAVHCVLIGSGSQVCAVWFVWFVCAWREKDTLQSRSDVVGFGNGFPLWIADGGIDGFKHSKRQFSTFLIDSHMGNTRCLRKGVMLSRYTNFVIGLSRRLFW